MSASPQANQEVASTEILELARADRDVLVVTSDSRGSGKLVPFATDDEPFLRQVGFKDRAFPTVYQLYGPMFEIGLDVRPEPTEDRTVARTVLSIVADIALPAGGTALVGALLPDAGASMIAASTLFKKQAADAVELA